MEVGWFVVWLVTWYLATGLNFAYWQRGWPQFRKDTYLNDAWFSIFVGMAGPVTLVVLLVGYVLLGGGFKGWLLPFSKQSKLEVKNVRPEQD